MPRNYQPLMILLLFLMLVACGVKMDLPTESNEFDPVFSGGDTSYIRISPDWDEQNGYELNRPWDLIVGADGYLFIADGSAPSIHVVSAAGQVVTEDEFGNDFTDLMDLVDQEDLPIYPYAIHQDSRLNLFVADSSNRLFVWNQYLENVGVDSVASAIAMRSETDELMWLTQVDSVSLLESQGWTISDYHWTDEGIENWEAPRLFWDASDSLEALEINKYFVDPSGIRITGVSSRGDMAYVADANANAILGLTYTPVAMILTGVGNPMWVYEGSITERTVSSGTGNGTVNDPRGMVHGPDGGLYYAQWGENFSVHKVGGGIGFEYGQNDIMDIERFSMASDVALDALSNIYVADTGNDRIQQFNSIGQFTFNIGLSKVFVDSTIFDSLLVDGAYEVTSRDTTIQVEVPDILNAPRAVAVDASGIVYIADTNNDRVMRFRLSTELDYTIDE